MKAASLWVLRTAAACLLLFPAQGLADPPGATRVAVVGLDLHGELSPGVKSTLSRALRDGLGATDLEVVVADRTGHTPDGRCDDAACRRLVAGKLGCRFVVGGKVRTTGEDRSYAIELWLADGYSGKVLARVAQQCEICGLKAIADRMGLAASALRAKATTASRAPARVIVDTSPPGARIEVDGDPVGEGPRQLELPAGTHRVTARARGYIGATRTVEAVAGVEERLEIKLIPAASGRSWREVAGWSVLGGAIASLAVATAMFVLDGRQTGCSGQEQIPGGQCPELWDTRAGAWTAAGIGLGAGVLGVYLLVERPSPAADTKASSARHGIRGRF